MTFLYKCRACGAIDRSLRVGADNEEAQGLSILQLCNAIKDTPRGTSAPTMPSLHSCGPLRIGISDLIGCAPSEEKL